jgi:hypothetical protein
VQLDDPPDGQPIMEQREHGNITVLAHPGFSRVVTVEYDGAPDRSAPVDLADLRRAAIRIAGTDFGMRDRNGFPGSATPRAWPSATATGARSSPATRRTFTSRPEAKA